MENKKYYTPDEVHYMDAGIWTLGNDDLRNKISVALSKIPTDIVDDLCDNCYFLIESEVGKASYFPVGFFDNKAVIIISDIYFKSADDNALEHTIMHEVAHHALKHKNPWQHGLSKEEYDKQEKEANEQVEKWLNEYEKADPITKLDGNEWAKEFSKQSGGESWE
jgi:hypothetical protein